MKTFRFICPALFSYCWQYARGLCFAWKTTEASKGVLVLCALCALGFKKGGKVRKIERYITQRSTYRIRIGRFGSGRGYISTGIAEIYLSSTTGSDIHYRMLVTMVWLTFLLKCCVMIQQEGIMQDVYTFAGTYQCKLPEYGPYSYICKSTSRTMFWTDTLLFQITTINLLSESYYFQVMG